VNFYGVYFDGNIPSACMI